MISVLTFMTTVACVLQVLATWDRANGILLNTLPCVELEARKNQAPCDNGDYYDVDISAYILLCSRCININVCTIGVFVFIILDWLYNLACTQFSPDERVHMQQTSRSGTMEGHARTSGVVAMKATMHGMLLQGVGLGDQNLQRARWFNLTLDDDIEHMIYLNAVRIDHATESVVLDVAVLSPSVEHAALDQSRPFYTRLAK